MLALNSSVSIFFGIHPLEKQGKERRKEGGRRKSSKPSLLLLLLLLPDGKSVRTMLGTDVVYISVSNYSCIYLLSKWRSTTFTNLDSHLDPEKKHLDSLNDPQLSGNKDRVTHSLTDFVCLKIKTWNLNNCPYNEFKITWEIIFIIAAVGGKRTDTRCFTQRNCSRHLRDTLSSHHLRMILSTNNANSDVPIYILSVSFRYLPSYLKPHGGEVLSK